MYEIEQWLETGSCNITNVYTLSQLSHKPTHSLSHAESSTFTCNGRQCDDSGTRDTMEYKQSELVLGLDPGV